MSLSGGVAKSMISGIGIDCSDSFAEEPWLMTSEFEIQNLIKLKVKTGQDWW